MWIFSWMYQQRESHCMHTWCTDIPLFPFHFLSKSRSALSSTPHTKKLALLAVFFWGWWNGARGFGRLANADSLFRRITEASLWMEIKLVWMKDLGTAKAQGLPLSRRSFLNRELTPGVREEKDASSTCRQNVIWAPSRHFHIKDMCEGCCSVDLQNTLLFHFFIVSFTSLFSVSVFTFSFFWSLYLYPFPPWTDVLFFSFSLSLLPWKKYRKHNDTAVPFEEAPENKLLFSERDGTNSRIASLLLLQRDPQAPTSDPSAVKRD